MPVKDAAYPQPEIQGENQTSSNCKNTSEMFKMMSVKLVKCDNLSKTTKSCIPVVHSGRRGANYDIHPK